MADNFAFTPGNGATGAAKDVGGVLYPEVIIVDTTGADAGISSKLGSLTETAPATDTASSGLNGRLQRIAQRLTTLIGSTLNVAVTNASIAVTGTFWQATQPVSTADGSHTTFGAKADAKSTATDTTAVSAMSVWKQISASVQAIASSIAGTLTVGLPTGASTSALQTTGNTSLSNIDTATGSTSDAIATAGSTGTISAKLRRITQGLEDLKTLIVLGAGSALIGDVGLQPRTSGGLTMTKTVSAASTNATSVKGSAGQVYSIQVFNTNSSARYLKLYNKATAPTVGTDTPVKTFVIPGSASGAGAVLSWPQGIAFGTGIAFALTTGAADSDTGAVAASEIIVNIDYK